MLPSTSVPALIYQSVRSLRRLAQQWCSINKGEEDAGIFPPPTAQSTTSKPEDGNPDNAASNLSYGSCPHSDFNTLLTAITVSQKSCITVAKAKNTGILSDEAGWRVTTELTKNNEKVGKFCCKPHTHTLTHTHSYTHSYMHTQTHTYTHCAHMHTHLCTHKDTHIHTCAHTYTHSCTHAHTPVHTQRHTHTHTHTHAHRHGYTQICTHMHIHTHTFQESKCLNLIFFNIYESYKTWLHFCNPQNYTTESMITSETLESLWL